MFDDVVGLPTHPLIVHAVVVLLPLMSVLTVLVALVPSWRKPGQALLALVGDVLIFGVTWLATESGEVLQDKLKGAAERHGELGGYLPYFAFGLVVAALVLYAGVRRRGFLLWIGAVLVVLAAAGSIGWTLLVGHTGADEVWGYVYDMNN